MTAFQTISTNTDLTTIMIEQPIRKTPIMTMTAEHLAALPAVALEVLAAVRATSPYVFPRSSARNRLS
ncbi:MAG: hypothetical protein Q8O75_00520 [bacterium]|nr:hypothetical protein [bacterium]